MLLLLGLQLAAVASAAAPPTPLLYSTYRFNPLEHLGGVTPYFEPQDPPTDPAPPRGCTPVRAAYLVRHAAIYTSDFDYEDYIQPFVAKWQNRTAVDWAAIPGLSFLASWTPPLSDAEAEMLTRVGRLEATQLGTMLTLRYPGLRLPPRRVWASSASRTAESARAFARGLQLHDGQVAVVAINESDATGANSLTPYKACPRFSASAGAKQSAAFLDRFAAPITARLNGLAPGFGFDANDVYGMMALCGYESVIRGGSSFCESGLFRPDEWLAWEYASDLSYHYSVGYGSPLAGALGLPWLNATAELLTAAAGGDSAAAEDLYVSFTHRELPPTVLVAMGLFNNSAAAGGGDVNASMPADSVNHRRAWRSSHVIPFLSNIAVERLSCAASPGFADGEYYRALVNNAPQPLPGCADGPGTSCSRGGFDAYLRARAAMFPDGFAAACGVTGGGESAAEALTIYTDPSGSNGTLVKKRRTGLAEAAGDRHAGGQAAKCSQPRLSG